MKNKIVPVQFSLVAAPQDAIDASLSPSNISVECSNDGHPLANKTISYVEAAMFKGRQAVADAAITQINGETPSSSGYSIGGLKFYLTGGRLAYTIQTSLTLESKTASITISSASLGKSRNVTLLLSISKIGAQGIQGLQGQQLLPRGIFNNVTLAATSEEIYFNDSRCDYIVYVYNGIKHKYRLNRSNGVIRWTKNGYYTADAPTTIKSFDSSHPMLPSGTSSDNFMWVVFSEMKDTSFNLLIADSFASESASMVEVFIGTGGTVNDEGSITLTQGANGWAIKNGKIWHTKTGVCLNANGTITDPDGLSLIVGGKKVSRSGNLLPWGALANSPMGGVYFSTVAKYGDYLPYGLGILMFYNSSSSIIYNVRTSCNERTRLTPGMQYTFSVWMVITQTATQDLGISAQCYGAESGGVTTSTSRSFTLQPYSVNQFDITFTVPDDKPWFCPELYLGQVPSGRRMLILGASLVVGTAAPQAYEDPSVLNDLKTEMIKAGIDIDNKSISLYANMLRCFNLAGLRTAWLDDMGNFSIAGVVNNLIQVISGNWDDYGYFDASGGRFFINPLRMGKYVVIEYNQSLQINLPIAHNNGVEGVKGAGENFTLTEMRQMVGKKIYFLPAEGYQSLRFNFYLGNGTPQYPGDNKLLLVKETQYGTYSGNNDIADLVNAGGYSEKKTFVTATKSHPSSGTEQFFILECKVGRYYDTECIYWELESTGQILREPTPDD